MGRPGRPLVKPYAAFVDAGTPRENDEDAPDEDSTDDPSPGPVTTLRPLQQPGAVRGYLDVGEPLKSVGLASLQLVDPVLGFLVGGQVG